MVERLRQPTPSAARRRAADLNVAHADTSPVPAIQDMTGARYGGCAGVSIACDAASQITTADKQQDIVVRDGLARR